MRGSWTRCSSHSERYPVRHGSSLSQSVNSMHHGILDQNIKKGNDEGTRKKIFCLTCKRKIIPRKMFRLAHSVAHDL
jgi:hypothetical protein